MFNAREGGRGHILVMHGRSHRTKDSRTLTKHVGFSPARQTYLAPSEKGEGQQIGRQHEALVETASNFFHCTELKRTSLGFDPNTSTLRLYFLAWLRDGWCVFRIENDDMRTNTEQGVHNRTRSENIKYDGCSIGSTTHPGCRGRG